MREIVRRRALISHESDPPSDEDYKIQDLDMDLPDALDPPIVDFDPPRNPAPPPNAPQEEPNRRARVEDIEDDDDDNGGYYIQDFPRPAGTPIGKGCSYFEQVRQKQRDCGQDPWAPFEDKDEWELAQWLLLNVGQNATDKFLKLPIVSPSEFCRR